LEEKLDPRDLDELLTEMTIISSRSELYKFFLFNNIVNDLIDKENESQIREAERIISDCQLNRSLQELIGHYSMLENYFMIENINKAIQMDSVISSGSKTSSVVDDVFFIIKKCLK
jgi:hypothetical protein